MAYEYHKQCLPPKHTFHKLFGRYGKMVSAGTKRKRRERGNRVAAAVEDGRAKSAAEQRRLGTVVTSEVPNESLFVEDRKGKTKEALEKEFLEQAAEQRRAAKRARRAGPKPRKSEAAISRAEETNRSAPGKKKKGFATVDMEILAKRKFDKPRGHVGNMSEVVRQKKIYNDGKEDVWMGKTAEIVAKEIGLNRRRIAEKMNTAHRTAPSVIHPSDGLSVNPTHADHQDKLGEALAKIVERDDEQTWAEEKMKFDPKILNEPREGEVADTGMNMDIQSDDSSDETEQPRFVKGVTGERKTRTQKHKEARKRAMASNIAKKKAKARRQLDLENIEKVSQEAQAASDKLSGMEKLRRLQENPPLPKKSDDPIFTKLAGQKVRNETASEPVPLSTELSECMRSVKMPVANPLLRDRFLSFERRGLIAPPKVLPKELWRMEQAKQQEALKDRRKRKGRGSRSNLTFWKKGKSVIQ